MREGKSKSQIKREMQALQKVGERLVELSSDQVRKIDIPEELREAVLFAQTMKKREARRRQIQYIGSLMRHVDTEPILTILETISNDRTSKVQTFHQIETWRDRLIEGNNDLVEELLHRFSHADRRHLSQLIRNARKEKAENRTSKFSRALFRYLKELSENETKP
jgi:ribosome-associated protein